MDGESVDGFVFLGEQPYVNSIISSGNEECDLAMLPATFFSVQSLTPFQGNSLKSWEIFRFFTFCRESLTAVYLV